MDWSPLEILGFITGLFYLWFEYHASRWMWLVSVIMPMISMWIYYDKGLYADFGINIYYLLIAIYGFLAWRRGGTGSTSHKEERRITRTPGWAWGLSAVAMLALWGGMGLFLDRCTDSTVPWADAFTTSLSIVGMWLLARKYLEQWWAWIVVDAVCVWLYAYKGIYFYSALYLIYTLIAFFGYRKWLRLMAISDEHQSVSNH